jgi:hypothetical protein
MPRLPWTGRRRPGEEERALSRTQIEDERRLAREQEQLAEAYAVQVVLGERSVGEPDDSVKRLAVMAVNCGSYTIRRVEAQVSYDGKSRAAHAKYQRLPGFGEVRERLRDGWSPSSERALHGVLTPRDAGIRFESDDVHVRHPNSPYPPVRWTDRWGRAGSIGSARCGASAMASRGPCDKSSGRTSAVALAMSHPAASLPAAFLKTHHAAVSACAMSGAPIAITTVTRT